MHWSLIYLISEWVIRLVMLIYVPQQRTAAASRTWLLLIFLLPWPGLVIYALFGRIYVPKQRIEQQQRASRLIRLAQEQMGRRTAAVPGLPEHLAPLVTLATRLGDFEPFNGNRVELLAAYAPFLDRLVADIDAAQAQVHLLFYIYENDATGRRVSAALVRGAAMGIMLVFCLLFFRSQTAFIYFQF